MVKGHCVVACAMLAFLVSILPTRTRALPLDTSPLTLKRMALAVVENMDPSRCRVTVTVDQYSFNAVLPEVMRIGSIGKGMPVASAMEHQTTLASAWALQMVVTDLLDMYTRNPRLDWCHFETHVMAAEGMEVPLDHLMLSFDYGKGSFNSLGERPPGQQVEVGPVMMKAMNLDVSSWLFDRIMRESAH